MPNPPTIPKNRHWRLRFAAFLCWFTVLGAVGFAGLVAYLYREQGKVSLPVLAIGLGSLVLAHLSYLLCSHALRCVVCGLPVYYVASPDVPHPQARKFLGMSFRLQVAKEVLFQENYHCIHCWSRCRSKRGIASPGAGHAAPNMGSMAIATERPMADPFAPAALQAIPEALPLSSPLPEHVIPSPVVAFMENTDDRSRNKSKPERIEPLPLRKISNPERTPWAHHTESPFSSQKPVESHQSTASTEPTDMNPHSTAANQPPQARPAVASPFEALLQGEVTPEGQAAMAALFQNQGAAAPQAPKTPAAAPGAPMHSPFRPATAQAPVQSPFTPAAAPAVPQHQPVAAPAPGAQQNPFSIFGPPPSEPRPAMPGQPAMAAPQPMPTSPFLKQGPPPAAPAQNGYPQSPFASLPTALAQTAPAPQPMQSPFAPVQQAQPAPAARNMPNTPFSAPQAPAMPQPAAPQIQPQSHPNPNSSPFSGMSPFSTPNPVSPPPQLSPVPQMPQMPQPAPAVAKQPATPFPAFAPDYQQQAPAPAMFHEKPAEQPLPAAMPTAYPQAPAAPVVPPARATAPAPAPAATVAPKPFTPPAELTRPVATAPVANEPSVPEMLKPASGQPKDSYTAFLASVKETKKIIDAALGNLVAQVEKLRIAPPHVPLAAPAAAAPVVVEPIAAAAEPVVAATPMVAAEPPPAATQATQANQDYDALLAEAFAMAHQRKQEEKPAAPAPQPQQPPMQHQQQQQPVLPVAPMPFPRMEAPPAQAPARTHLPMPHELMQQAPPVPAPAPAAPSSPFDLVGQGNPNNAGPAFETLQLLSAQILEQTERAKRREAQHEEAPPPPFDFLSAKGSGYVLNDTNAQPNWHPPGHGG